MKKITKKNTRTKKTIAPKLSRRSAEDLRTLQSASIIASLDVCQRYMDAEGEAGRASRECVESGVHDVLERSIHEDFNINKWSPAAVRELFEVVIKHATTEELTGLFLNAKSEVNSIEICTDSNRIEALIGRHIKSAPPSIAMGGYSVSALVVVALGSRDEGYAHARTASKQPADPDDKFSADALDRFVELMNELRKHAPKRFSSLLAIGANLVAVLQSNVLDEELKIELARIANTMTPSEREEANSDPHRMLYRHLISAGHLREQATSRTHGPWELA